MGSNEFVIVCYPVGNLALSRALGDFCFKKNDKKSAEEQIVTGTVRWKNLLYTFTSGTNEERY